MLKKGQGIAWFSRIDRLSSTAIEKIERTRFLAKYREWGTANSQIRLRYIWGRGVNEYLTFL